MRSKIGSLALVALLLSAVLVAVANAASNEQSTRVRDGAHPLDPYPGFGRSPKAADRDDTIAYWEAFRREQLAQKCMATKGFNTGIRVQFPPEAVLAVAKRLGVKPSNKPLPEAGNDTLVDSLDPIDADRFYEALVGETLADIRSFETSGGAVPEGLDAGGFAQGGCKGEARNALPGIWSVPRQFQKELANDRASVAVQAGPPYRECVFASAGEVASNPGDVESLLVSSQADSGRSERLTRALEACSATWRTAYSSADKGLAKEFIARHPDDLGAVRAQYADTLSSIASDDVFLSHLARAAGGIDPASQP